MVREINIETNLIDEIKNYDVILVGTSIKNTLSNGFQHDIAVNFPKVNEVNNRTKYDSPSKLGTCEVVTSYCKDGFPIFVICYITKGRYRPDIKPDALDYDALKSCLELVNKNFCGMKVASTLIGSEKYEGGGDAKKIYMLLSDICKDIDLTVYDYVQEDFREKELREYLKIGEERKSNAISREEYEEKMKNFLWEKNFGKYLFQMPQDKTLYEIKKIIKEKKNEHN